MEEKVASYNVAVKNKKGVYQHFEVPEEVFIYIQQLEAAINYPEVSKIKEVYRERFPEIPLQLFQDYMER